jgi:hypothetical protein
LPGGRSSVTTVSSDADAEPKLRGTTGAVVKNPRLVLESALRKMSSVSSLRVRLQMTMTTGDREVVVETVKPDRMRVTATDGEIVVIGRNYYYRPTGGVWQAANSKSTPSTSALATDYSAFVGQMLSAAGVTITGRNLGEEVVDGVETVAYEFTVTDGVESGTITASIGKDDAFLRRLALSGPAFSMTAWFTSINESITIEKPEF